MQCAIQCFCRLYLFITYWRNIYNFDDKIYDFDTKFANFDAILFQKKIVLHIGRFHSTLQWLCWRGQGFVLRTWHKIFDFEVWSKNLIIFAWFFILQNFDAILSFRLFWFFVNFVHPIRILQTRMKALRQKLQHRVLLLLVYSQHHMTNQPRSLQRLLTSLTTVIPPADCQEPDDANFAISRESMILILQISKSVFWSKFDDLLQLQDVFQMQTDLRDLSQFLDNSPWLVRHLIFANFNRFYHFQQKFANNFQILKRFCSKFRHEFYKNRVPKPLGKFWNRALRTLWPNPKSGSEHLKP